MIFMKPQESDTKFKKELPKFSTTRLQGSNLCRAFTRRLHYHCTTSSTSIAKRDLSGKFRTLVGNFI